MANFLAYLIVCWEMFSVNTRNKVWWGFWENYTSVLWDKQGTAGASGRCCGNASLTFWPFSSHYDGEIVRVTLISSLIVFYLWNLDTVSSWNLRRNLRNNSFCISTFAWENVCLQRVSVAQVDRVCACAAGALQLCVSRDLLWYSMAPEPWPWAVTVCVLTQGHCISPSEGERRFKCAAALCSVNLTARVAPNLLPFQLPPPHPLQVCVQHEQHLRVCGGHVGLHQLPMPDQSGAESGLPGNLGPRRSLQARPVRGAEDAVARAVVWGTAASFIQHNRHPLTETLLYWQHLLQSRAQYCGCRVFSIY